jgi:signal transduction histidine kinase
VKGQRAGGTGLGLTICKYYVELHRGGIRAVSDLGRGARFEFWIPKGLVPDGEGGVAVRSAG